MVTVEKLILEENMGIAFGILSLGGTEPEIHLRIIYPSPLPPRKGAARTYCDKHLYLYASIGYLKNHTPELHRIHYSACCLWLCLCGGVAT